MKADRIIVGKHVFLENEMRTQALCINEDRIVATGPAEDMISAAKASGSHPRIVNYEDAYIYPGFHDSHLHFFHSAVYSSPLATTFLGENEADCVTRLKKFAETRAAGWLLAQGWREYLWNPPVMPSKHSLDAAFPNRPVALYSGDAHTLWLNSTALHELGISKDSQPPKGGYFGRDENGELTGIVGEVAAMELMARIMKTFTDEEVTDAYRGFLKQLAHLGVTSICDMALAASPGLDFIRDDIYEKLLNADELTARVHMFPTLLDDMTRFEQMHEHFTGPMLQALGFKQFFDGVSSQHTAWLAEPYTNAIDATDKGRPSLDPKVMRKRVLAAAEHGWPVRIHTIGDEAIHQALNIFEEAREKFGPLPEGRHNCLEHLENFQPEDIARLAELDVVAAVQPQHITLDPGGPERDLGPERVPYMWPFRQMLDAGTTLAFGTDSPVVDPNPLNTIYEAVTRRDPQSHEPSAGWLPEERITRLEALKAHTEGSAQATGRAHELGKLKPGMLADITVLDQDLITCAETDIQKAKVLATYVGGKPVF